MWPFSRNNKNTLNTVKVPIVFVPGVMGSRLQLTGLNWDPNSTYAMAWSWRRATQTQKQTALASRQQEDPGSVVMKLRDDHGFDSVAEDFYGDFLKALAKRKFASATTPVYAVGYDWRRPIQESANLLRARVIEIMLAEDAKRVIVISHSMGGLVSRTMFKQYPDLQSKVAGAVHVVQPAVGAVVLYRRFFTGMQDSLDGEEVADKVFNTILGRTPPEFAALISVLPGPMQLCPSGFYHCGDGWLCIEREGFPLHLPEDQSIFDAYGSPKSPPGIYNETLHHSNATKTGLNEVRLKAKAFHDWIQTYKLEGKTWAIFSTGVNTDVEIFFAQPDPDNPTPPDFTADGIEVHPTQRAEGDGTVPQNSANSLFSGESYDLTQENTTDPNKHQFQVNGVKHSDAFKSGEVQEGVYQLAQQAVNKAVAELKSGQ